QFCQKIIVCRIFVSHDRPFAEELANSRRNLLIVARHFLMPPAFNGRSSCTRKTLQLGFAFEPRLTKIPDGESKVSSGAQVRGKMSYIQSIVELLGLAERSQILTRSQVVATSQF